MDAATLIETLTSQMNESIVSTDDIGNFIICLGGGILFGLLMQTLYYTYFHRNEPQDGSLARSLTLLTPALTATFWMIQSSLILSLGLLGSLSFVRFRTPIKRSEDISFIVVALAVAIACATNAFVIAFVLVGMLGLYTIVRNWYIKLSKTDARFAVITVNSTHHVKPVQIVKILEETNVQPEFISSRTYDGITSMVFNAGKLSKVGHEIIQAKIAEMDHEAHINIFYPNERLGA